MSVELDEVRAFIAASEPFGRLPDDVLDGLPQKMTMRYIRRGDTVIARGSRNDELHIIRSGAVDVVGADDLLLDRVEAGRTFGYSTLVGEPESRYDIIAVEDTLVLVLPREEFQRLTEQHPDLDRFYSSQSRRIAHAATEFQDDDTSAVLRTPLRTIIRGRSAITAPEDSSIQDVAALMSEHDVSSLLITRSGQLVGILTDKDLRSRVVARRHDVEDPVSDVMTPDPLTVNPGHLVFEAMLTMSEHGIHHLPVVDDTRIHSVVTSGDVSRLLRTNPLYLTADIARHSLAELTGSYRRAAETLVRVLSGGRGAHEASGVLTTVADALVRRLAELAQEKLGPPPVDWCFVVVGSQGRREMGPASDQDNALILDDAYRPEEHGDYFAEFSRFICEGLDRAGQVLCPGEMMAMTPQWRMTRTQWLDAFHRWVTAPEPDALLNAQIYFDMRGIAGNTRLADDVHAQSVGMAHGSRRMQTHLAALASRREPPLGFFRGFVVERGGDYDDTLNVKRGGTAAIVQLARLYSLKAGDTAVGTRERLQQAAGVATAEESAQNLLDAFDYVTGLSLQHQARQLRAGETPDYHIDPSTLSTMSRENLRDAFNIIKKAQGAVATTYPVRSV